MNTWIRAIIFDTAMIAGIVAGLEYGYQTTLNAMVFLCWAFALMGIIAAFDIENVVGQMSESKKAVYKSRIWRTYDSITDFVPILLFAAHEYFWLAGVMLAARFALKGQIHLELDKKPVSNGETP